MNHKISMLAHPKEQEDLESYITRALKDLGRANSVRIKAGLQILTTTDFQTFETLTSKSVQEALQEFKTLLLHPETQAPLSSQSQGQLAVKSFICDFIQKNLNLIDNRTTILPDLSMVTSVLTQGEHLRAVVHSAAIQNVVAASHFVDDLERKFKDQGLTGKQLETAVTNASAAMAQLHNAVLAGNIWPVIRLLAIPGVDINLPNPDGLPLLHLAVREGHLEIVQFLLSQPKLKVNLISNNGWTALHLAARLGYPEIVAALLQVPTIDVNIVNSDGWTALHWAAWNGNIGVVEQLFKYKNQVLAINARDRNQTTPLHWAARNGQADIINLMSQHPQLELNPFDNERKTPLLYAVIYDHLAATVALLDKPTVEVNPQDIDGLSPLHWAARNGQAEILKLLLNNPKVNRNIQDNNNMTAKDWLKKMHFSELLPLFNGNTNRQGEQNSGESWLHRVLKFFKIKK